MNTVRSSLEWLFSFIFFCFFDFFFFFFFFCFTLPSFSSSFSLFLFYCYVFFFPSAFKTKVEPKKVLKTRKTFFLPFTTVLFFIFIFGVLLIFFLVVGV